MLEVSSHHKRRIRPSAKCADIRRSLKAIKLLQRGTFRYEKVYGHMDRMLRWEQLTLPQQLNCVCDTLAKRSVTTAINHGYHDRPTQLLPKEDAALVIWGTKITGNISPHLRFHASKEVARRYLTSHSRDKWSNDRFDAVDWEHFKQDMYRICQNNILASAAQGFKWDDTWVIPFPMRDAQTADVESPHPILCSARTQAVLNCWARMSQIWRHGCRKPIKLIRRSFIGFQNIYL